MTAEHSASGKDAVDIRPIPAEGGTIAGNYDILHNFLSN
jgi:hypothetical protein